jgi:hypothetical protein
MSHTLKRRSNRQRVRPLATLYAVPVVLRCSVCAERTTLTCYGCGKPVCGRHHATRSIARAVVLCRDCASAGLPVLTCAC